jgi:tight adherence protein B
MISKIRFLTFVAVAAAGLAIALARAARRARTAHALYRRLGVKEHADVALLLKQDGAAADSLVARLALESGLGWTPAMVATRTAVAALLAALVGGLLGGAALAFFFALAGLAVVPLYLRRAHTRRLALCDQQMPQALEVMSLALSAGHPLPGALAVAASEAPSPIADELRRAVDEHELGRPISDVLVGFGQRLAGCESVHTFVVAVLVLQQTGGNLIQVIERIVENARARASYHQRLRALTAEGRSSAKMLAALPGAFAVLAAMADPSYARTLLADRSGNVILVVTLLMWAAGVLWTRHLVREDA